VDKLDIVVTGLCNWGNASNVSKLCDSSCYCIIVTQPAYLLAWVMYTLKLWLLTVAWYVHFSILVSGNYTYSQMNCLASSKLKRKLIHL